MADIFEVLYAILKHKNMKIEDIEEIRLKKQKAKGAFDKKIFLLEVEEECEN